MKKTFYRGRRAVEIENREIRAIITEEGGHIASLLHKDSGVNPLWTPEWRSVEPSEYSREQHPEFGESQEAQLVAGLLGHSLCLDLFGTPTETEAAAGIPVHGEAPVAPYQFSGSDQEVTLTAALPLSQLRFTRTLRLLPEGVIAFREQVENLSSTDRPIGWTQHVTLGAPFLEPGKTRFLLTADRSRVIETPFNEGLGQQRDGADFSWPNCPRKDGGVEDLSVLTGAPVSGGFTAHRMDPAKEHASFVAWSPSLKLLIGYVWKRKDFPWLARWEENHLRPWAPWNKEGFALGMEFGVSPMVESRQDMVSRARMFDVPCFLWLGAKSNHLAEYCAFVRRAEALPAGVEWDGAGAIVLR